VNNYQSKVRVERLELDFKLENLRHFFNNPIYAKLHPNEQARLQSQAAIMQQYLAILDQRIHVFDHGE